MLVGSAPYKAKGIFSLIALTGNEINPSMKFFFIIAAARSGVFFLDHFTLNPSKGVGDRIMDRNTLLIALALICSLLPLALYCETTKAQENAMKEIHQQLGVDLFNQSWDILLKENRGREDEDKLLNMVHASLYHWRQVGAPINILRGEWMICHVYTLLEHKESALYHAENVLRLMEEQKPTDWDLAYCYEAMARVQALLGNKAAFEKYYALAVEAGEAIVAQGDRQQFESDLNDEYWFGMK